MGRARRWRAARAAEFLGGFGAGGMVLAW
jgi:hypothetical protein